MAFKYEPYQSTYVDPQSVKIAEILRDRFIQNFNAADAVGTELSKLKAADFENDQKLKSQIDADVRGRLGQYAESGAYEDMTFRVAETARDYRDRSAPVTENYNRYVAYQQDLAKQYQKGKISSKAYRNAIPMTKALGYSGISLDPNTGMVDPNSYFSGPAIVADPKITEQLIKVLNQIEADSSEKTISGLYVGEDGQMKYTSKQGWEGITEQKVNRAYEAVMALPEVQEYLNQEAKYTAYENYANPDGSLNPDALGQVTAAGIEMHKAEMNKLSALIGSPKTSQSKKQQYQATLNAYQQSMSYLEGLKDPAQQLNYAASLAKEQLLAPYQAIAAGKVYSKSSSSYEEDYSEMEKDKRRADRAKQAEIEKLAAEAASKITIAREGTMTEIIDDANVEVTADQARKNIKDAQAVLDDPNAGVADKESAKERLATNYRALALSSNIAGGATTKFVRDAIGSTLSENPEVGDIDNWGFGTYGRKFKEVYEGYKAWRGGSANEEDFYGILNSGPTSAEYQALATNLSTIHEGEDGNQLLADSKAVIDTKLAALGSKKVRVDRNFNTRTAPVGTSPVLAQKAAEEIQSQFKTLGDLSGINNLIYRPKQDADQTFGDIGGEGGILENWSTDGFTANSKITNVRYGVANGLEMIDKSETGQYAILTVAPTEEAADKQGTGEILRPYKEIYVPIEKVASADMIKALNEPFTVFHRDINTLGYGTAFEQPNKTFIYEKTFTEPEKRAIMFSKELTSMSATDAARFLKENAATFEEYVTKGYLERDGSFAGSTDESIIVEVKDINNQQRPVKAEISLVDINGQIRPLVDPRSGERIGQMDVNSDILRSIMNDQNVGLYHPDGYILKQIK